MQPAASIVISKRRGVCEWQNFSGSLPNPLLTNASKVSCRQVGVNSSSSWQGTLPTRGLDNIKESPLPSPETKQVSIHFSGLRNKNRLASHLFFSLFFFLTAPHLCACIGVCCFLYLITVFMLLDRLKAGSCLVISNLYICGIGHFKEQTVWFKRLANRNELPRAGAKGKSTTIQRNTKTGMRGGRYGGILTAASSCTMFGIRVCQRGEKSEHRRRVEQDGGGGTGVNHRVTARLLLLTLSICPSHSPSSTLTHTEAQLESFVIASPWHHIAT